MAGLRPYRAGGPRLEVEFSQGRVIGHNYGHGGSGITLAWGSCLEILELLQPQLQAHSRVAVLGAGIMGLCSAWLLQRSGHQTTLYAREFPPQTTSDVAGGLWAPTHLGLNDPRLRERLLRRSLDFFRQQLGPDYGVEEVTLWETDDRAYALDPLPPGLLDPPQRIEQMPFSGYAGPGQKSSTLLIETSRFLQRLRVEFEAMGGRCQLLALTRLEDIPEGCLVNCLGLGAREVFEDPQLQPIRGQLVLLDPLPDPFVLDHARGYVISRRDGLILGGTFEEGIEEPTPVRADCQAILEGFRAFLRGD